jgi:PAS domain S-box-containing protein
MHRSDEELGQSSDVRLETTEYDRLLEQARDADEQWRALIENPFDFVCIVDRQGVYQHVKGIAPGISREDLIGKATIYDHLATDCNQAARQALDRVFSSATTAHFEGYWSPPVDAWFSTVVGPLRRNGDLVSASLLSRDITARKTAEAARRESEERFQQLAESIDDVFYLLDSGRRRLLYVSPAYEKIWGRPLADLERKPSAWQEGIHPEDRMEVLGRLRAAVREYDRSMEPIEYRVMRPDGSVRWVRHRAFGVRHGLTASHRIAGIITDITDEREFLEESRRARAFSLRLLEAQEAERSTLSSELEPDAAGSGLCARVDNGTVRLGWNALSRPNRRRRWRPSAIGWWKLARAVLGRSRRCGLNACARDRSRYVGEDVPGSDRGVVSSRFLHHTEAANKTRPAAPRLPSCCNAARRESPRRTSGA